MGVRYCNQRQKWRVQLKIKDQRFNRDFTDERDATDWELHLLRQAGVVPRVSALEQIKKRGKEGTLGQLVRICEQLDWAGKDPSQLQNAARLCRLLGQDMHVAELTMRRLDDLVVDLRGSGLSNTTIKKYISAVSVMLKRSCRLGHIDQIGRAHV